MVLVGQFLCSAACSDHVSLQQLLLLLDGLSWGSGSADVQTSPRFILGLQPAFPCSSVWWGLCWILCSVPIGLQGHVLIYFDWKLAFLASCVRDGDKTGKATRQRCILQFLRLAALWEAAFDAAATAWYEYLASSLLSFSFWIFCSSLSQSGWFWSVLAELLLLLRSDILLSLDSEPPMLCCK